MEKSEKINEIAKALIVFSSKVGKIGKAETAEIPTKSGKSFSYSYASLSDVLEAIEGPLRESGLAVTQIPDGVGLVTLIMHAESGQWIQGNFEIKPVLNEPRAWGSAITYNKRYSLGAFLRLNIDEDDDGGKASKKNGGDKAASTQNDIQINGDLLEKSLDEMQLIKTMPALTKIFNENKTLQKNPDFIAQFKTIKANIEAEALK